MEQFLLSQVKKFFFKLLINNSKKYVKIYVINLKMVYFFFFLPKQRIMFCFNPIISSKKIKTRSSLQSLFLDSLVLNYPKSLFSFFHAKTLKNILLFSCTKLWPFSCMGSCLFITIFIRRLLLLEMNYKCCIILCLTP